MLLIFFIGKWLMIRTYNSYEGKVTHITGTSIPIIYKEGGTYSNDTGTNNYPYVEYYVNNDTLNITKKGWSRLFLNEGDKVTVLVDKVDDSDVMLLTFFNYWLPIYSIIIFFFIGFIGYGAVVSIDQKEYLESLKEE